MRQHFHTHGRGPVAMQILEDVFGQDPPGKFEDLDQAKVEKAKQTMLRRVLASASSYKGNVLHRFQRIGRGDSMEQREPTFTTTTNDQKNDHPQAGRPRFPEAKLRPG